MGSMDLMNGQASNVNIAATASEVRIFRSLAVEFLTWHSDFSSIMVGHRFNSEFEKRTTNFLIFKKLLFFIFKCLFERERGGEGEGGRTQVGEGQREKETQDSSRLCADSLEPDVGLNLQTLRSWPEPRSSVRRLTN